MFLDIIKLLEENEVLEIRNRSTEIEVVLRHRSTVYSSHIFQIRELQQFRGDEKLLFKDLINELRREIKQIEIDGR